MRLLAAPLLLALLPLTNPTAAPQGPHTGAVGTSGDSWAQDPAHENSPQVYFYEPKFASTDELADMAESLFGRELLISDEAGQHLAGNIFMLGDNRILIFELPSKATEILGLFKQLDVPGKEAQPKEAPQQITANYTPKHIPLEDVALALTPFSHPLENGMSSITTMRSSNLLVMHDTQARIAEMNDLLARIDVAAKQIELTCYVLQASNDPEATADKLPPELTSGLIELLPFYNFELSTMGVLRLSTAANSHAELDMQLLNTNASYKLSLQVGAFDPATQDLSLLGLESGLQTPAGYTSLFRTDASILGDEYAVMGATGAQPTFVVLHFKPIG